MKPLKAIEVFMFSAQSDLDLQDINLFGQKPTKEKKKRKKKQNKTLSVSHSSVHAQPLRKRKKNEEVVFVVEFEIEGQ